MQRQWQSTGYPMTMGTQAHMQRAAQGHMTGMPIYAGQMPYGVPPQGMARPAANMFIAMCQALTDQANKSVHLKGWVGHIHSALALELPYDDFIVTMGRCGFTLPPQDQLHGPIWADYNNYVKTKQVQMASGQAQRVAGSTPQRYYPQQEALDAEQTMLDGPSPQMYGNLVGGHPMGAQQMLAQQQKQQQYAHVHAQHHQQQALLQRQQQQQALQQQQQQALLQQQQQHQTPAMMAKKAMTQSLPTGPSPYASTQQAQYMQQQQVLHARGNIPASSVGATAGQPIIGNGYYPVKTDADSSANAAAQYPHGAHGGIMPGGTENDKNKMMPKKRPSTTQPIGTIPCTSSVPGPMRDEEDLISQRFILQTEMDSIKQQDQLIRVKYDEVVQQMNLVVPGTSPHQALSAQLDRIRADHTVIADRYNVVQNRLVDLSDRVSEMEKKKPRPKPKPKREPSTLSTSTPPTPAMGTAGTKRPPEDISGGAKKKGKDDLKSRSQPTMKTAPAVVQPKTPGADGTETTEIEVEPWLRFSTFEADSMVRGDLDEEVCGNLFLHYPALKYRVAELARKYGARGLNADVCQKISEGLEEKMRNLMELMAINSNHRYDDKYEELNKLGGEGGLSARITRDTRSQIKFFERIGREAHQRKEEEEKEKLMRAAKSRSKFADQDPNLSILRQRAKEVRAEEEQIRTHIAANATALAAIGGTRRKNKPAPQPQVPSQSQPAQVPTPTPTPTSSTPSGQGQGPPHQQPQLLQPGQTPTATPTQSQPPPSPVPPTTPSNAASVGSGLLTGTTTTGASSVPSSNPVILVPSTTCSTPVVNTPGVAMVTTTADAIGATGPNGNPVVGTFGAIVGLNRWQRPTQARKILLPDLYLILEREIPTRKSHLLMRCLASKEKA